MVYFMTPDLVPRLYDQSMHIPYIFMDDVYVTGLLASRLKNPVVYFKKLSVSVYIFWYSNLPLVSLIVVLLKDLVT